MSSSSCSDWYDTDPADEGAYSSCTEMLAPQNKHPTATTLHKRCNLSFLFISFIFLKKLKINKKIIETDGGKRVAATHHIKQIITYGSLILKAGYKN
jgi:hypothetical protein